MGCDGGSIPRRDEMVKLKKKAEKAEKNVELAAKWRHCAISAEKLQQPIVACDLGRLYNKESILMALLDKSNMPEIARHIKSLKDVVELKLTTNPSYKPNEKADTYNDVQSSEYICPVTGLEMSGHHRFAFLRGCGCVLSEKALKEVPSEACHKCGQSFTKDDIVIINGTEEDIEKLKEITEKRKQAKLSKRKRKADSQKVEQEDTSDGSSSSEHQPNGSSSSSEPMETSGPSTVLPKLPDPVLTSAELSIEKRPKLSASSKSKSSKSSSASGKSKGSSTKKTPQDKLEKRDAYRSLFTSTAPARSKEHTSHWVTFFPYH